MRYPKLMVGSVEQELSWVPHFLDRLDYNYTQRAIGDSSYRFKGDALPSDSYHSNVFPGFQEDALGIRDRHIIGVDKLLRGSDYPHQESTFPRSREIIEEILVDCTEEEKSKIAGANSARVYRLQDVVGWLAQLVRAPALHAGGRRFESCTAHHCFLFVFISTR